MNDWVVALSSFFVSPMFRFVVAGGDDRASKTAKALARFSRQKIVDS
jgi:hypothetical protein